MAFRRKVVKQTAFVEASLFALHHFSTQETIVCFDTRLSFRHEEERVAKAAKIDADWEVLERISWLAAIGCWLSKSGPRPALQQCACFNWSQA
jgi:hypothetical protein